MWHTNTVITINFKGPTSVVMTVRRTVNIYTCISHLKEGSLCLLMFIIHWHYKYSLLCHCNKTTCLFRMYVESFCQHLHPNVRLFKSVINHIIDALLHWYCRDANTPSLWGIQSLRLHLVLAAVKIEMPLLHSSGTLPSGGRSSGTGGDRLAHASWPVSFGPSAFE